MRRYCRNIVLIVIIFTLFCSSFVMAADEEEKPNYIRGKVLKLLEDETETAVPSEGYLDLQYQYAEVKLLNGENKGETIVAENVIDNNMAYNINIDEGDEVLLFIEKSEDGKILNAYVAEIVRQRYLFYLAAAFILLLALVGGIKGFKAVLTLFLTGVAVIKILLPLMLKGYNPIMLSVFICAGVITVTLLIISGFNKKTFSAIIGTAGGVIAAGAIALVIGSLAKLTGLGNEEARMLMFIPQEVNFNFEGLLFAGIIIGALGAVMDVGMSIASAMSEIEINSPEIKTKRLIQAGLNVGRDIMGTMSNTLILAYTGGSLHILLLFLAYDYSFVEIVNMDMVASEIVRALAGSIGLIFTIPLTAIVAGTLGRR